MSALSCSLSLTMQYRCKVCRRMVVAERATQDTARAAFVGSAPWALCVCGMEMAGNWSPAYRRRWLDANGGEFEEPVVEALKDIPVEPPDDPDDWCNARVAADEAIAALCTGPSPDDGMEELVDAEAWLWRALGYVRRERRRMTAAPGEEGDDD